MKGFRFFGLVFLLVFCVNMSFAQLEQDNFDGLIESQLKEESNLELFDDAESLDMLSEEQIISSDDSVDIDNVLNDDVDNKVDDILLEGDEILGTSDINFDQSNITKQEVVDILSKIDIGFCNEGVENMSYSLDALITEGSVYKVCLMITNASDKDVKINMDFSEVVVDSEGSSSCAAGQGFKEFVKNADEISSFDVPSMNYVVKEAEVLFPVGIDSNQGGCFAIWLDGEQNNREGDKGGIFIPVISRIGVKAKFYVGSLDNIKNELDVSNVKTNINENGELILKFDVSNLGNLENKISISGLVSNIFGFKKTYSSEQSGLDANILPGLSKTIEVNMGLIPNYGGLFNVEFNVTGIPYFSYELSDDFDKSLLEPLTYTEKTTYFEMPWLICIIVVIVIILLIVLFRRPKPQVVYVQAPQQPQQPQYQNPQYQQPVNNQVPQQPQYQQPQQSMQQ